MHCPNFGHGRFHDGGGRSRNCAAQPPLTKILGRPPKIELRFFFFFFKYNTKFFIYLFFHHFPHPSNIGTPGCLVLGTRCFVTGGDEALAPQVLRSGRQSFRAGQTVG